MRTANIDFGKPDSNETWAELIAAAVEEKKRIQELETAGHPYHCACRQVWGDGECECDLYGKGYDPYAWLKPKKES